MDISLELYKAFYYVGKTGGITPAAEAMCVSQPAVSQSVKQLEAQLGVKLFYRKLRGMALTVEGQKLFEFVSQGLELIKRGEEQLGKMKNMEAGEIKIGASDMTLQFYLLPFLEHFHEKYPGVKVSVTNAPTPETIHFLEKGEIDFGVISTPFDETPDMDIVQVKEIENVFVGGPKFKKNTRKLYDYKELTDVPIICLEKNTSTRTSMDQFLLENGVVIEPEFELATSDMIVQFALKNLGIGMVVRDFAKKEIEAGNLFELKFNRKAPKRHICVVHNRKYPLSTAAKQLKGMLKKV